MKRSLVGDISRSFSRLASEFEQLRSHAREDDWSDGGTLDNISREFHSLDELFRETFSGGLSKCSSCSLEFPSTWLLSAYGENMCHICYTKREMSKDNEDTKSN